MSDVRDLLVDDTVDLMGLLRVRHWSDILVTECKLGPTWSGGHRRMDAWVMRCSWSNWGTVGYEVKRSRADFRQDKKWRDYLSVCSQFYFVCPAGLIEADEVEDPAGLIWASKSGKVLRTRKAAKLLKLDDSALVRLFGYLMMNRVELTDRPRHGKHARETEATRYEHEFRRAMRNRREKRVGHALARVYAENRRGRK